MMPPRKIDFPPLPGTEDEQWDKLAKEFDTTKDEIAKELYDSGCPSWMFDKGFINKWDVRKILIDKGYTQKIQPEEENPEKTYNEWLEKHPFTKRWYETCPQLWPGDPGFDKPKHAEIINAAEKIDLDKMDTTKPTKKEIKIEKQCDPRDIYITENNRNPEREAVEKRMKEKEQNILKAYAGDRKREEIKQIKQEMEKCLLSEKEERDIKNILHKNDVKKKEEYIAPECKIVEECAIPGDFDGICRDLMALHARKNKDYGNAAHESYKEFGIISYVIRLNDKMKRLKSLTKPGVEQEVKGESIEDTLMDLAAYAIMAIESLKSGEKE